MKQKVRETVEHLIVEEGVDTFLFGSRSKFDELCHIVVTELKEKYPRIQRIAYLCKHETACLVGVGMDEKRRIKELTGRDVYVPEYEDVKKSDRVNSAGRACYVERNQLMIDNSDCVIVCCNQNKGCNKARGGALLAKKYADLKKKIVINCFDYISPRYIV